MILGTLACIVLILLLQFIVPFWWWIMIVPFAYCVIRASSGRDGFWNGAICAGVVWLAASFYMFLTTSDIVAERVADMFFVRFGWVLIILTTIVAVIAGGVAGCAGYFVKAIFIKEKK